MAFAQQMDDLGWVVFRHWAARSRNRRDVRAVASTDQHLRTASTRQTFHERLVTLGQTRWDKSFVQE